MIRRASLLNLMAIAACCGSSAFARAETNASPTIQAAAIAMSAAAPPARRRNPCDRPECRQFDFWIGSWDVFTPDSQLAGTSVIEPILNGCVLLENWTATRGPEGKSFNQWTASDSLWHQTWVSGLGMLNLAGTFHDGRMILQGGPTGGQSAGTLNRITWTPMPDGQVKQHWQTSADAGATWSDAFVGMYRKHGAAKK